MLARSDTLPRRCWDLPLIPRIIDGVNIAEAEFGEVAPRRVERSFRRILCQRALNGDGPALALGNV